MFLWLNALRHIILKTLMKICKIIVFNILLILAEQGQVFACSGGSGDVFWIPVKTAFQTYGLSILTIVLVETLLFKRLFQIDLKKSAVIMVCANLTTFVLYFLIAFGNIVSMGVFLLIAAFIIPYLSVRLLHKDGFLVRCQKFKWVVIPSIYAISIPVLLLTASIGHSLVHRGARILGTPVVLEYYAGLFFYGIFAAVAFEGLIVTRMVKNISNVYAKLASINFVSYLIQAAIYLMIGTRIIGEYIKS